MLGLERDKVVLTPYQDAWAHLFNEEKRRLEEGIGRRVLEVQHVGSTSILGMKAKPVLDLAVAVENFEEASALVPFVEKLGYTHRGEHGVPRRHYFVKDPPENRTHHLHMLEVRSENWRVLLQFRDHLKAHPETVAAYQTLKENLAKRYPGDRNAYTDGKYTFIQEVLRKAQRA